MPSKTMLLTLTQSVRNWLIRNFALSITVSLEDMILFLENCNLSFRMATFANNLKMRNSVPFTKRKTIWIKQITDPLCPNCTRTLWMINFGNILWIYLKICCVHIVNTIVVNVFWLKWSTTGKSYLTKITLLELFLWTCQIRLLTPWTYYHKASSLRFK